MRKANSTSDLTILEILTNGQDYRKPVDHIAQSLSTAPEPIHQLSDIDSISNTFTICQHAYSLKFTLLIR